MAWIIGFLVLVFILPRLVKARREHVSVFPGQPISTLHSARSRKTSRDTKAALDAATALLR